MNENATWIFHHGTKSTESLKSVRSYLDVNSLKNLMEETRDKQSGLNKRYNRLDVLSGKPSLNKHKKRLKVVSSKSNNNLLEGQLQSIRKNNSMQVLRKNSLMVCQKGNGLERDKMELEKVWKKSELVADTIGIGPSDVEAIEAGLDERKLVEREERTEFQDAFKEKDVLNEGCISAMDMRELLAKLVPEMQDEDIEHIISNFAIPDKIQLHEFMGIIAAKRRLFMATKYIESATTLKLPTMNKKRKILPPLKLPAAQTRSKGRKVKSRKFNKYYGRSTPKCLRPGTEIDITGLRRELAISEYGLKQLDGKVRKNVEWIQYHCPGKTDKSVQLQKKQGAEKAVMILLQIATKMNFKAFRKWQAVIRTKINTEKANLYLKIKASRQFVTLLFCAHRKKFRRTWKSWNLHVKKQARIEQEASAIELQRISRGFLVRARIRGIHRNESAIQIQRIVRGHLHRLLVVKIQHQNVERNSAVTIQRWFRAYRTRQAAKQLLVYKRQDRAIKKLQLAFRVYKNRQVIYVILLERKRHVAATRIQKHARSMFAKRRVRAKKLQILRVKSSIIIQKVYRRRLATRVAHNKRNERRATIQIQRRVRGIHARRRSMEIRNHQLLQNMRIQHHRAAVKIQSWFRSRSGRYAYHVKLSAIRERRRQEFIKQSEAATKIQSLFRGHRGRKYVKSLRYKIRVEKERQAMHFASLRIQTAWRVHQGKLAAHLHKQAKNALYQEEVKAATRIQAMARGYFAKILYEKMRIEKQRELQQIADRLEAATNIQSVFRGRRQRKIFIQKRTIHREEAQSALDILVARTRQNAAIRIQCCARKYLARLRYKEKLRKFEESKVELERQARETRAAIIIQCNLRKKKAMIDAKNKRIAFNQRLKALALAKADDEISELKKQQEEELEKMRFQILREKEAADQKAKELKEAMERELEAEKEKLQKERDEIVKLQMQNNLGGSGANDIIAGRQRDDRVATKKQRQLEAEQKLADEASAQQAAAKVAAVLAASKQNAEKLAAAHAKEVELQRQMEEKLKRKMLEEQATFKIQIFFKMNMSRKKNAALLEKQKKALAAMENMEQKRLLRVQQEQELAQFRLEEIQKQQKADKAKEKLKREMEEEQVRLESAKKQNERDYAVRKIQGVGRGYLARKKAAAVKAKNEEDAKRRKAENDLELEKLQSGDVDEAAGENDEWVEYWDENAQATYYFNIRTQEASWTRPSQSFEAVVDGYDAGTTTDHSATGQYNINASNHDAYGYYDSYGAYQYYDARASMTDVYGYSAPNSYQDIYNQQYQTPQYDAYNYSGGNAQPAATYPAQQSDWLEQYDPATGGVYYYNQTTGETRWA